nr:hypothetical protein 6 [Candidatus Aminicenantes bacterium]
MISDIVKGADKRIAIFGKFSNEDEDITRHIFRRDPDSSKDKDSVKTHKLNAQTFFDVVKPELRFSIDPSKNKVMIGDNLFHGFELFTPIDTNADEATKKLPILLHSHMLSDMDDVSEKNTYKAFQTFGGQLFKDLIAHADRLSRFSHPNFSKAISSIINAYVPIVANKLTKGTMAQNFQTLFRRQLREDILLRGEIIKYILCLEDDETSVKNEITRLLSDLKDSPFSPDKRDKKLQIEGVIEAIERLKDGILNSSSEVGGNNANMDDDFNVSKFMDNKDLGWVENLYLNNEFFFDVQEESLGANFLSYIEKYKESSDWISRFVRTDVLHSYVYVWLASKYSEHNDTNIEDASMEMFKTAIQGQKVNRRIVESRETQKEQMEKIEDELKSALKKAKDKEQIEHLRMVQNRLKSYFVPSFVVTRGQLRERCERLFVETCSLAGGIGKTLHDENKLFTDKLFEIHQPFIDFLQEKKEAKAEVESKTLAEIDESKLMINTSEVSTILKNRFSGYESFIDELCKGAEISASEIKERFVTIFSREGFKDFNDSYSDKYSEIKEERRKLKKLYNLRDRVSIESTGENVGLAVIINNSLTIPEKHQSDNVQKVQKNTLKNSATKKSDMKTSVDIPIAIQKVVSIDDESRSGKVTYDGKEIGFAALDEHKLMIERDEDIEIPLEEGEIANPEKIEISFEKKDSKEKEEELSFALRDMDAIPLENILPESQEDLLQSIESYDELYKWAEISHEEFIKNDSDKAFQKKMRAMVIGETILAVPRGKVNLDSKDLSNNIGVIMELAEQIGDPKGGWYDNKEIDDKELLKNVNLSEFYPFSDKDEDEMAKILEYHYSLCNKFHEVKGYLNEVKEMREFFESVRGTDVEVSFVNKTFAEYNDMYNEKEIQLDSHLTVDNAPLAIYASKQSNPLKNDLSEFYEIIKNFYSQKQDNPGLQIPIVMTSHGINLDISGLGLPVITEESVNLPTLGTGGISVDKYIQKIPDLMFLSSLLNVPALNFGRLEGGKQLSLKQSRKLSDMKLPVWNKADSVFEYLRKCWKSQPELSGQIILLKLINEALTRGFNPHDKGDDSSQLKDTANLTNYIKPILDDGTWKSLFNSLPFPETVPNIEVCEDDDGYSPISDQGYRIQFPEAFLKVDNIKMKAPWLKSL